MRTGLVTLFLSLVLWAKGEPAKVTGWSHYWWALSAVCGVCVIGFMIGYRGRQTILKAG